jgi:Mn-dependent DtxR family transcriptional regulator
MKMTPSHRESQALSYIALCNELLGHSPTQREIARRLGIKSRAFVREMLDNLERKGLIKIKRYQVRGIEIVPLEFVRAA